MALQEANTRTFFYILERSYSSVDSQPPQYVASAPEFCTAPKFAPIVSTGSNEREALNRLKYHIKVFTCCLLMHNVCAKKLSSYCLCAAESTVGSWSKGHQQGPCTWYKSLEHYLEVDGGTAEDCEDIIVIYPVLGMPDRLPCWDVIDFLTSKDHAHDHTSGDDIIIP